MGFRGSGGVTAVVDERRRSWPRGGFLLFFVLSSLISERAKDNDQRVVGFGPMDDADTMPVIDK